MRLLGSCSVDILLNGVFAFLPKCASNGDIFIVFWRYIRSWYIIEFTDAFKLNWFRTAVSIHAKRFLIVWISLSKNPIALWSCIGASTYCMLFWLQNALISWLVWHRAWSSLIEWGTQCSKTYSWRNFKILSAFALSNTSADWNLENRSIHARK